MQKALPMLSLIAAAIAGCQTKPAETLPPASRPAVVMPVSMTTTAPTTIAEAHPATQPIDAGPAAHLPYTVTRFAREGPLAGVVIKLDLSDPRVHVTLTLTDDRDPDGDGPAVGRLDAITNAAARQDLEIAMNASYFNITGSRVAQGKKVGYFVGNGAYPVGWEMIDHKLIGKPVKPYLKSCLVVHDDGHVTIEGLIDALPKDTKYAVSGSSKCLTAGVITPPPPPADGKEEVRHPRSCVGISADGKTMLLMAIDGRRPTVSRGVTIAEEAALLKEFGAADGINLDGGGSTALVVKDAVTGVYAIINKPSEFFSLAPPVDSVQRPVIDMLGVQIDDE